MREAPNATRRATPAGLHVVDDLPLAGVDILGAFDASNYVAGNAVLAELVGRTLDDAADPLARAARRLEDEQLGELAAPAGDLADVALKLGLCVRLGHHCLHGNGTYGEAVMRLLGSLLADVVLLRQAELVRRDRPAAGGGP